ncbi:SpaA isopeptide-forming pilin-related protein [Parafannyhessea sp. LCP21S3_E6]|uniref:SpaA isopeptide-forming pilin-related protein n=1 Tax=unclassified Parafannyhessea TaxID=2847323 RepID=UPI003F9BC7B3
MNKHTIARAAASAGLAVAMTLGSVAPATMAWAADGGTTTTAPKDSITIKNATGNTTSFKGYKIFAATVTDDSTSGTGKKESDISWASTEMQTAVVNYLNTLKDSDGKVIYTGKTAQDAADFISNHITSDSASSVAAGTGTRVDSTTFANGLAKAIEAAGLTADVTVSPNTATTPARGNGYYLFVTDQDTVNEETTKGEDATSPIFAVVGGSAVTVTEKTSVPTVDKKIVSDATGKEGDVADSQLGQNVTYKLYGTVADNVATYDTYYYEFSDSITKGLDLNTTSGSTTDSPKYDVHVTLYDSTTDAQSGTNGTDVTGKFTTAYAADADASNPNGHVLTVKIGNLKGMKDSDGNPINITKDSCIVVSYTAHINSSAVIGSTGNPNTVKLVYSSNPHTEDHGETTPDTVRDYTYKLVLHKVDRTTEKDLKGAKFTIQATTPDDTASANKYVQENGSLGDTAYEFTTDENGQISVEGLDAGTYTVKETTAPTGYSKTDDFTFQIKPTYGGTDGQELTKLENVLTATDSAIAGDTDGDTSDNVLRAGGKNAADANTGTVKVTIGDVKSVGLPLTGQAGIGVTLAAGGAVLALGVYRVVRSRREQDAE